ncbi:isoleucine--tRNA ligase [Marinoscillum sp. MHG1-6]|uniref:isoleucine--tRNA ligase n=1 Tax=Marinoscillum sp. MHG1-6 TaxID=2959627 RepID=UPI0021577C88|nr:isoleucine--tRNA ligase [Marinoscillum sp. MHG1-6]
MKYPEYKQVKYPEIAAQMLAFWEENKVFEKSVTEREGAPTFTFYEGPPSANGTPGIHHVMARAVKDIFCRYKTTKGFQVKRKGGWDTHGLPVELQVEKELGIKKDDIGKTISVAEYNQKCREAVMKFKDEWDLLTQKMGYWVDLNDPYITFDKNYMESLWYLLKQLYDKGLLYKGYTIQPYSPAAGTGLSSHELNQPGTYKDVKDTTVVAQFKVKNATQIGVADQVHLLAWTTTPWTLPSNSALAIGENITYVLVSTYNQYTYEKINVILAKDLLKKYFSDKSADLALDDYREGDKLIPWQVVKELKGSELVGLQYEQLMPYVRPEGKAFEVIPGDFVSTEDGTGIVHIAPTFGADDKRVADVAGISAITVKDELGYDAPLVNKQGKFVDEVTDYAGCFVKEEYFEDEDRNVADFKPTDVLIAIQLKEENKAFKVEKYEHSYPHCWRTDKPVLYYPLDSWFIKTTALKDRLVALNNTINWKPASTGSGRFGNWLENLVDWNLSRSRFWGTPLPIWVTKDRKEEKCIGSIEELKTEVKKAIAAGLMKDEIGDDFDLHRPYVDDVILVSESGQPMYREPDLIDVWFDSGAMPYAQWHYPFENQDIFDANYPADFIAEGVDQTRGWFFTLHAIATLLYDKVAFKNVIANGLVLDKNGNKMSKRLGNAINPFETLDTYGADATRWYMISNANPWDNLKFDLDGVIEVQRKFFGTLTNTYSFFSLYVNLDGFRIDPDKLIPVNDRPRFDRWILSELQTLIQKVDSFYENYEPTQAARAIQDFVGDQLSNWYVRLSRKRFWMSELNADKQAAYETLYECLSVVAQLMSPIAPFYAEWLYKNLTGEEGELSVHLKQFPQADESLVDSKLSKSMHLAQDISSLVHSLRKKEKIKVRQPLQKILVPVLNPDDKASIASVEELIISEINVKEIEYVGEDSGVLVKKIKPNFRKLGQTFGAKMKLITPQINGMDQDQIKAFEKSGSFELTIDGESIILSLEDVEITSEDIPGWLVASEGGLTVALDITITDELKKEGLSRDVVNRLQNLRKDKGLEVQDKINVIYSTQEELVKNSIEEFKNYIQKETQALKLEFGEKIADGTALDIDGLEITVGIEIAK